MDEIRLYRMFCHGFFQVFTVEEASSHLMVFRAVALVIACEGKVFNPLDVCNCSSRIGDTNSSPAREVKRSPIWLSRMFTIVADENPESMAVCVSVMRKSVPRRRAIHEKGKGADFGQDCCNRLMASKSPRWRWRMVEVVRHRLLWARLLRQATTRERHARDRDREGVPKIRRIRK